MIKVFFKSNDREDLVATFEREDALQSVLPLLKASAEELGFELIQRDEEREWEAECEFKQACDLGIYDDYLERSGYYD